MLHFLYQALTEEFGIVIRVDDPERARQELYRLRREEKNPEFDNLSFVPSRSASDELWIIRRSRG